MTGETRFVAPGPLKVGAEAGSNGDPSGKRTKAWPSLTMSRRRSSMDSPQWDGAGI